MSLSAITTSLQFPFRKQHVSKRQQLNKKQKTKQDSARQGKSPHMEYGKGHPIGGKEPQEPEKELETYMLPVLGVLQKKYQGNSHDIDSKDLVQTHADAFSSCVPSLGDLVDHVPLVSSIPCNSCNHPLLYSSLISKGRGPMEASTLDSPST